MLKKIKKILTKIKSTAFYKDFTFQFFGWESFDKNTIGKKLMPLDIYEYELSLLFIHLVWYHWFTFWFGMRVSFFALPEYFRHFFLRDLWWATKEIAYAFWALRLPFVVTYINFAEYYIEFYLWFYEDQNNVLYPIHKSQDYHRFMKKYKYKFFESKLLNVFWYLRYTLKFYRKYSKWLD